MKKINNKTKGSVMVGAGFLLIPINAISYFISDNDLHIFLILGLALVVIGIANRKK